MFVALLVRSHRICLHLSPCPHVFALTVVQSARALGSLVIGVGEEPLEDLLPWLLETMQSDASSVERCGGAQGASEVLHALGSEKLMDVLRQMLPLANHPKPAPREGLLWLLAFLPSTMGEDFAGLINIALPVVLKVGSGFHAELGVATDDFFICRGWRMTLSLCEVWLCALVKLLSINTRSHTLKSSSHHFAMVHCIACAVPSSGLSLLCDWVWNRRPV